MLQGVQRERICVIKTDVYKEWVKVKHNYIIIIK